MPCPHQIRMHRRNNVVTVWIGTSNSLSMQTVNGITRAMNDHTLNRNCQQASVYPAQTVTVVVLRIVLYRVSSFFSLDLSLLRSFRGPVHYSSLSLQFFIPQIDMYVLALMAAIAACCSHLADTCYQQLRIVFSLQFNHNLLVFQSESSGNRSVFPSFTIHLASSLCSHFATKSMIASPLPPLLMMKLHYFIRNMENSISH